MTLARIHRLAGLFIGLLWCVQAFTGALLTFRWEIDDALLAGPPATLDAVALSARLEAVERAGGHVGSVWSSGSGRERFDIYYADASGAGRTMRVDGAGAELRDEHDDTFVANGAIFNSLTTFHESLFAGTAGRWTVGISGVLLLSNLVVGAWLAWPRSQRWRQAMLKRPAGPAALRPAGWHRLIGLWIAAPTLVIVAAGSILAYQAEAERLLDAGEPMPARPHLSFSGHRGVAPEAVLSTAMARYPGSSLTALVMPSPDAPWYRVRLLTRAERPRLWGTTTIFLGAEDGRVLLVDDPDHRSAGRRFMDTVYPVHTGQVGGVATRAVALLTGAGLAALFFVGFLSWRSRVTRRSSA